MCTGSCMFVFWMALRKFFADKIRPKVYDLILKIILIAYYVPAGYLLVNIFFDNGYVFDFTGTIIKAFYAISLFCNSSEVWRTNFSNWKRKRKMLSMQDVCAKDL